MIDAIEWRLDGPFGSARMIGNTGSTDLLAVRGWHTLSFIEVTPSGAVNLITVYGWEIYVSVPSPAPGVTQRLTMQFFSVWSRHTAVAGPSPSQMEGSCVALF